LKTWEEDETLKFGFFSDSPAEKTPVSRRRT
jgi:hypothetical protein